MSRAVMQQALEALENINTWLPTIGQKGLRDYEADAITAIKAALAQPEFLSSNEADIAQLIEERDVREDILDKVLDMVLGIDRPEWSSRYQYIDAVEDVRAALAQPEQWTPEDMAHRPGGLPQVEQEPVGALVDVRRTDGPWQRYNIYNSVARADDTKRRTDGAGIEVRVVPLYASPPHRQPLTDAEIWQMVNDCSFNRDLHADKFARAIEAAHDIKAAS